jgi:hypothetical protein
VTISDWAAIATAAGTLAAAAAAVWVALWTDRRAARRLQDEHERSDRLLSAAAGPAGARLIQVVYLEQRDDPGAVAAVEPEVAVAEPNSWILSPFRAASSTVPGIEGHIKTQGLAEEPDGGRVVPAGDAQPGRALTLMASRFTQSASC